MRFDILLLSCFWFLPILNGCSSKLIVVTEPSEVEIFLNKSNGERKSIGKSPLQIPLSELEKEIPLSASTGEMIELQLERADHESQIFWIPSAKIGLSNVTLFTKLKPGLDEAKQADSLLQYLHNAQKFASNGSFDRAMQEVDLAIEKNPKFIRALSMKGAIFFTQEKWDDSRVWYEKALALDNGFDEAVKMIDQIKVKKGERP